jgi:hypothetical protein
MMWAGESGSEENEVAVALAYSLVNITLYS